jgi:hypothetical protein
MNIMAPVIFNIDVTAMRTCDANITLVPFNVVAWNSCVVRDLWNKIQPVLRELFKRMENKMLTGHIMFKLTNQS